MKERRRERRRMFVVGACLLAVIVAGGLMALLRNEVLRIHTVTVRTGPESLAGLASEKLDGFYFGVIPRNSILFFPESEIRSAILSVHPEYAAVTIARAGLSSLSIRISERIAIARWCGDLLPREKEQPTCYVFDANGLIFAPATSSIEVVNSYALYAPRVYADAMTAGESPVGATLANADHLPTLFDFVRQTQLLSRTRLTHASSTGLSSAIVIHDGEVDTYLENGTRVSYVLGNEQSAYTALVSAQDSARVGDDTISYIDLRFDGRVYVKHRGE